MADRCKQGDMAIIIKDNPGSEANIGLVVHVEGPRKVFVSRGTVWRVRPINFDTMTYIDYDGTVGIGPATDIENEDVWLLPVRLEAGVGDAVTEADLPKFNTAVEEALCQ